MFGHDHVAEDDELISTPYVLENGEEKIAALRCTEQGLALVATRGDEVQITGAIEPFQTVGHIANFMRVLEIAM